MNELDQIHWEHYVKVYVISQECNMLELIQESFDVSINSLKPKNDLLLSFLVHCFP